MKGILQNRNYVGALSTIKVFYANSKLIYSNLIGFTQCRCRVFYKGRSNQAMTGIGGLYKVFFGQSYSFED